MKSFSFYVWNCDWQKATVIAKSKKEAIKMVENLFYVDRRFIYAN